MSAQVKTADRQSSWYLKTVVVPLSGAAALVLSVYLFIARPRAATSSTRELESTSTRRHSVGSFNAHRTAAVLEEAQAPREISSLAAEK